MIASIITSLTVTVITTFCDYIWGRYRSDQSLKKGVQALLRNSMLQSYRNFKQGASGNVITTTYAKKSEIPSVPVKGVSVD